MLSRNLLTMDCRHLEACLLPCHSAQAQDFSQKLASLLALLLQILLKLQVCCVEVVVEEKQNSLSVMKRDRTGDARAERNSLFGVALTLELMVKSQMSVRSISGFMAMQYQGSVSISMACITIRDHADIPGLGCHCLGPWRYPRAVQSWPCHSLAVALWKAGPTSHQLQHSGEWALVSAWQHSGAGPGGSASR